MQVPSHIQDAVDRIRMSKDGKVFVEYLQQMYQSDTDHLVSNDLPLQHAILQGKCRRSKEILSMFNPKQGT